LFLGGKNGAHGSKNESSASLKISEMLATFLSQQLRRFQRLRKK